MGNVFPNNALGKRSLTRGVTAACPGLSQCIRVEIPAMALLGCSTDRDKASSVDQS
jgi:hypothetical protein